MHTTQNRSHGMWLFGVLAVGLAGTAHAAGKGAKAIDPAQLPVPSFSNHVQPVLTKTGCNQGACHGAASGKNGFKMTLRGYDNELDYVYLTRQAGARRVNVHEPAESLLLLKATLAVPHAGGKRISIDSPEYTVLARWIAQGAPGPSKLDPSIVSLAVTPAKTTLAVGDELPLTVLATFSDGHIENVTRWTKFTSADESVAKVGEDGLVKMEGKGETAINIWYLNLVGSARVLVPFAKDVDARAFTASARNNLIDDHVLAKLKELGIPPAPACSDEDFVRRAYLDAAGILPTRKETEAFLADKRPDRRTRLIDMLLARPEYVDYWAYKWSDVLLVASHKLQRPNVQAFYAWLRSAVAANKGWDQLVRELTTSTGRAVENGAVNYFLIHRNPLDLAENYSVAFMGLALGCARCHNHPLEKWTQNDYYAFANLFGRLAHKSTADADDNRGADLRVYTIGDGDIPHPKTGQALAPKPLDGKPMRANDPRDRRAYLADWLTSPNNKLFSRTIVNRVWANFFGRGLSNPVDDTRSTNPASNEELFGAVTDHFVAHKFDVKNLIRLIMTSAAYQRSSDTNAANAKDEKYLSHYVPRRLPAEVLLDAIVQVTGVPETFNGYPQNYRAMQLPDTKVKSAFMSVFGRPQRLITSVAERQQDPTLPQALHAINGDTLNRKLIARDGRIEELFKSNKSIDDIVDELYLCAYSRRPTDEERKRTHDAWAQIVAEKSPEKAATGRREALEDLAWAMLTSKEFFFNH